MFSFGVLLAQIASGEYPRIDRRGAQLDAAAAAVPSIKPLLGSCVKLHPEDRPTAEVTNRVPPPARCPSASPPALFIHAPTTRQGAVHELEILQAATAKHAASAHGVVRTHAHGGGILAERWFRSELVRVNEDMEARLTTAEAR